MSNFKRPPSEEASQDEASSPQRERARKRVRRPNVYDAVAGRVSQWGLNNGNNNKPKYTPTDSAYAPPPLRPDEILFKARNAPTRYEESDTYFAHANLPSAKSLPSGDLLAAIHAYVSHFYARSVAPPVNQKVWKCMDETALIALGILMEESAKEILGETGDLAFTEGVDEDDEDVRKETGKGEEKISREEGGEKEVDEEEGETERRESVSDSDVSMDSGPEWE